nr:MAG TPA: hypothetical protein [Caudoviricetes sp.]
MPLAAMSRQGAVFVSYAFRNLIDTPFCWAYLIVFCVPPASPLKAARTKAE